MQVEASPSGFTAGSPTALFDSHVFRPTAFNVYSVSPDGQRVLVPTPFRGTSTAAISMTVNWPATLKR